MEATLSMYEALKRMRKLTELGVPFSFTYMNSKGQFKIIEKAVLRSGYRRDQSKKSMLLVAYTDVKENQPRQFHRSLLVKLNNTSVK